MPALTWDGPYNWDDPRLTWDGEAPEDNPMPTDNSFCYITRPTAGGATMTTQPKYRGTKTQAEVYAEVAARLGSTAPTVANVTKTLCEVVTDWTIACWKIEALGDGLIAFQAGCGGSAPIGEDPPNDFVGMGINLNGYWGAAGKQRAQAAFSASKVGEQGRISPIIEQVMDSASHTLNHYASPGAVQLTLGNRQPVFDPNITNHFVRYRKADGTFVTAGSYPYHKGKIIVANVPSGLTGALEVHLQCEINGSIREGIYPFPITP